jgi:serine/threonine protein phosphatase PrpC
MSGAQRDGEDVSAAVDGGRPPAAEPAAGSATRIVVRCAGRTAVGQVRDHNEDNFVVANLGTGQIRPRDQVFEDYVGDRGLIFAVCDGMGGAAAGEVASQMAVDILVEAMRRGGAPRNRDALARRLVSAVEEAGKRIYDAAQKERSRRGMGTTATVAVLVDKVLFLAEVGDSRAYLMRRGQLKQLTKDQSLVNQLIEAGHLTEDEAEAFEHSNIILQALGTSETVQVDLTFVELRRGDRLMMCSDGLSGLVHVDMLRSTLDEIKDPADCGAKLIEYAETAGGHDNITVVVADFDGEGLTDAGDGDTFGYVQYPLPLSDGDSSAFADESTVGGRDRERTSDEGPGEAPPQPRSEAPYEQDHDESLLPLSPETGDPRGSVLWVVAGVCALALAAFVWVKLQPAVDRAEASESEHHVQPKKDEPATPSQAQAGAAGAAAEAEQVEVNIHTDVEQATLFVNGEAQGEVSSEQSRNLKLPPGNYRFEAHSAGSQIASTEVMVRGDMPMDVFLELPKGASDAPKPDAPKAAETPAPEEKRASTEAEPRRSKPKPSEAAPQQDTVAQPSAPNVPVQEVAAPAGPATKHSGSAARARPEPEKSTTLSGSEPTAQHQATAATPAPAAAPKPQEIPDNPF